MGSDNVKSSPPEGVYIHGLFLEGCGWSKENSAVIESEPKTLYVPLPVLHVTAMLRTTEANSRRELYDKWGPYDCPTYKYRNRTDRFFYSWLHCAVAKIKILLFGPYEVLHYCVILINIWIRTI